MFAEVPVTAVTPSATIPAFNVSVVGNAQGLANNVPLPLSLPTGWSLRASTHNAESFTVIGFGGDF
jgi:hypothetical protein